MRLQKYATEEGSAWSLDGWKLPSEFSLDELLTHPLAGFEKQLLPSTERINGMALAPIDEKQEVWASGVTYLRSRVEREAESTVADVYAKVYEADRPELFFKALPHRVVGPEESIYIRRDSDWNVPEPELTLVINRHQEIVGYTVGNDVSSRSIEGENPLYLPQAKSYDGSCALGPAIVLCNAEEMRSLEISLSIVRGGDTVFSDSTSVSQMKRSLNELVEYLGREMTFWNGVFLMTGTGIVPAAPFTLQPNDVVSITIGGQTLTNPVARREF